MDDPKLDQSAAVEMPESRELPKNPDSLAAFNAWSTPDSPDSNIAVPDRADAIACVNQSWGEFATCNGCAEFDWRAKLLEEKAILAEAAQHAQNIVDNLLEGVITADASGIITSINKAACRMFGYDASEIIGRNVSLLMPFPHRLHHDAYLAHYREAGEARMIGLPRDVDGLRKDGSQFPMRLSVSQIDRGGQPVFVSLVGDITQRLQDEEEIRRLAFFDPLTGLANRRLLLDRLGQARINSLRTHQHAAVMMLDLDHFKHLNDQHGHDLGDLLLQKVGERLRQCVRETDSVARFGGDEFVLLLEALSARNEEAAAQAEVVASKILKAFAMPFELKALQYASTSSIGITVFRGDHDSGEELLKKADIAMYQAKTAGRNAAHFYDPALQTAIEARAQLESELREGLEQQEYRLVYQLQVNSEGQPTGAEALIRWQSTRRGLISPDQFLPLSEQTGLIRPLGQWVLDTACAQLADWAGDPRTARWTLSVNISASQISQADFVESVFSALRKTGANPFLLRLELKESMLVHDIEDTLAKMRKIRTRGVGFSLDDFGTGFSSLTHLKRLPLDQLKIDQSFVQGLLDDADDAQIANTVVTLGHTLGFHVIAEGVETAAQRDFLARIGCDGFQGYLFGKPVDAGTLTSAT